jgi:DNA-binding XRE family transcriptional regulator
MPFVFCNTLENLGFYLCGTDNLNDFVCQSLSRSNVIRLTLRVVILFVVFPLFARLKLFLSFLDILYLTKKINIAYYLFFRYFCTVALKFKSMGVVDNLKLFIESKNLTQKEVYTEIGLKPAHYNKLEKELAGPSIDILEKLFAFYNVTIDEITYYSSATPKEVTIGDKTVANKLN